MSVLQLGPLSQDLRVGAGSFSNLKDPLGGTAAILDEVVEVVVLPVPRHGDVSIAASAIV